MRRRTALITGVTGQDGSYLADLLLAKDYRVVGLVRRGSTFSFGRIDSITRKYGRDRFEGVYGDLEDSSSIRSILSAATPDEIYNLGAQSHVGISFKIAEYTADVTGVAVVRLLEAIRDLVPHAKFYQASSSEVYGDVLETPQSETTPFNPVSPYGCAKAYAFFVTKAYRTAYRLFAVNGILFNHESPRRGENFVSRKITSRLAAIRYGLADCFEIGNLESKRDWGYAPDYVECMWQMLQQNQPGDYVIATGESRTVREFINVAAGKLGFELEWHGKGLDEVGIDRPSGQVIVKVNPAYFRPAEVNQLCGDPSQAVRKLGWNPRKTSFDQLVAYMVTHDSNVCEAMVRLKERWPNLPIDSFRSAFLRELALHEESAPVALKEVSAEAGEGAAWGR